MDGYLYLTLENAAKYVLPYVDVVVVALLGAAAVFIITLICKGKTGVVRKVFKLGVAGIILFWILNSVQLPVYTNIIADGKTIQSDSIKIADYLNGTDCDLYYLVVSEEDEAGYLRNFYGYVQQTYQVIDVVELEQMMDSGEQKERMFLLVPSRHELDIEGMEKISLATERLSMYMFSIS